MRVVSTYNDNLKTIEVKSPSIGPISARWSTGVMVYLDIGDDTYAFTGTTIDIGIPLPPNCV
jgi:hypothetical protein